MAEKVDFTLENIALLDYFIPKDKNLLSVNDNVTWWYSFKIKFSQFTVERKCAHIIMSYAMYFKNDPDKKTLARVEIDSMFSVTDKISINAKLIVLTHLLSITLGNLQGTYAAKSEGTSFADILPSELSFTDFAEGLKKQIADEWK